VARQTRVNRRRVSRFRRATPSFKSGFWTDRPQPTAAVGYMPHRAAWSVGRTLSAERGYRRVYLTTGHRQPELATLGRRANNLQATFSRTASVPSRGPRCSRSPRENVRRRVADQNIAVDRTGAWGASQNDQRPTCTSAWRSTATGGTRQRLATHIGPPIPGDTLAVWGGTGPTWLQPPSVCAWTASPRRHLQYPPGSA